MHQFFVRGPLYWASLSLIWPIASTAFENHSFIRTLDVTWRPRYGGGQDVRLPLGGKLVALHLVADPTMHFHLAAKVTVIGRRTNVDSRFSKPRFYKGLLVGDASSEVRLRVDDNDLLTGTIVTSGVEYHIEPSFGYGHNASDEMIIYTTDDLSARRRESLHSFCGVDDHSTQNNQRQSPDHISSSAANMSHGNIANDDRLLFRTRRNILYNSPKDTCLVFAVADSSFYAAHGSISKTRDAIFSAINYANSRLETIAVTAQNSGQPVFESKTIHLGIKEVLIYTDPSTEPNLRGTPTTCADGTTGYSANTVLENFRVEYGTATGSETNLPLRSACIGHLFTNVEFCSGVLGLATTASACKYWGSLNTDLINVGLTTLTNWGQRVPSPKWELVTTHEIGHNFGANHDSGSCAVPGSEHIMNAEAVHGTQLSNTQWSTCSKNSINSMLQAYWSISFHKPWDSTTPTADSRMCLVQYTGERCGDGVLQQYGQDGRSTTISDKLDDEECDAGDEGDSCCYGSDAAAGQRCRFKGGATCSPVNSPCCTNCQVSQASENKACFIEYTGGCSATTFCKGQPECGCNVPPMFPGTTCLDNLVDSSSCVAAGVSSMGSGVCVSGVCQDVCTFAGATPCSCTGDECSDCCTGGLFGSGCLPANSVPTAINGLRNHWKTAGTPCFGGSCNDRGVCVQASADPFDVFSAYQVSDWIHLNIVATTMTSFGLLWISFGALMCRRDRNKRRKIQSEMFLYATGNCVENKSTPSFVGSQEVTINESQSNIIAGVRQPPPNSLKANSHI